MTTKSVVESAWAEDVRPFLCHLDPDTRKITRRLEKIELKENYSVPSSLTKLAWIYIYIYKERGEIQINREREREKSRKRNQERVR